VPTIIPLHTRQAHPDRDAEARSRSDRLNRATTAEMQAALAFLSMIDPDAFEIAFQAVPLNPDALPDEEDPVPLCTRCGSPVALFPDRDMTWHHHQAAAGMPGEPEVVDKGHEPQVEWDHPHPGGAQASPRDPATRNHPGRPGPGSRSRSRAGAPAS
jgi:hypothetical protein